MGSNPLNNIVREVARKSVFPDIFEALDNTISFNQGDYLVLKAGKVQRFDADADTVNGLGISPVTVVDGKLESPYPGTDVDAAEAAGRQPGPVYGVTALMILKTGITFAFGELVYIEFATDPEGRTVTNVAPVGGEAIGVYADRAQTAAAGDEGEIHIGAQFPAATLVL